MIARRVAIHHEINRLTDEMARDDYGAQDRADTITDVAADVAWSAIHHHDDLRGELVQLAAECQSWLEAIDAAVAR